MYETHSLPGVSYSVSFYISAISHQLAKGHLAYKTVRGVWGSEQRTNQLTGFRRTNYQERQNITEDLKQKR